MRPRFRLTRKIPFHVRLTGGPDFPLLGKRRQLERKIDEKGKQKGKKIKEKKIE